jgi:dihydroorotase
VIDPHVHLRDWKESAKETLRHGLEVAARAGIDAVFEMPNTDPPLTSRAAVERRIASADDALREVSGVFHGLYAGLTADPEQVREVVRAHADLFPRVVGLKLFAGNSTGGMGVVGVEAQRLVYRTLASLGYRGLVAVHAEKESLLRKRPDGAPDWDSRVPATHALARPPEAEVRSVEDQIRLAAEEGFRGTLHVAHLSVPESLALLRAARGRGVPFRLTSGLTPHHALLAVEDMEGPTGLLLKMNPPLRPRALQRAMLEALLDGEVDWVETDHAPHSLTDKAVRHASGIPGLPFHPVFVRRLRCLGMEEARLDSVTHGAVERVFGFAIPRGGRAPEMGLASEYPFDPFAALAEADGCGR